VGVDLHPRNRGFEWHAHPGPFRAVTPAQAAQYDERGFFLLERAFDADAVAEMVAETDPFEARVEAVLKQVEGGRVFIARSEEITFTTHLVARSARLRARAASGVLVDLAHDLIGPDVRLYWDQAVYKKPGTEKPFPWHQDNGYAFVEPQQYLTCWIALTDATEENGCPRVVPGLHRRGTLAHRPSELGHVCLPEDTEGEPVPARAGDVVVFSSLTPHCTGANRTRDVRKAWIVQYAPEGAAVLHDAPDGSTRREPATAPERQFPVLAGGEPVEAPSA